MDIEKSQTDTPASEINHSESNAELENGTLSHIDADDNSAAVYNQEQGKAPVKSSRWIGLIAIVLFFVFGGWSICPWYLWIVFAVLALITFGGMYKGAQAVLGIVLLIWGTSLFGGGKDDYHESGSSSSSYMQYDSSNSQSADEKAQIERTIDLLETMNAQFERAVQMGAPEAEQKRISDEAWTIYQKLQQKNLTPEQQYRLSKLFAL